MVFISSLTTWLAGSGQSFPEVFEGIGIKNWVSMISTKFRVCWNWHDKFKHLYICIFFSGTEWWLDSLLHYPHFHWPFGVHFLNHLQNTDCSVLRLHLGPSIAIAIPSMVLLLTSSGPALARDIFSSWELNGLAMANDSFLIIWVRKGCKMQSVAYKNHPGPKFHEKFNSLMFASFSILLHTANLCHISILFKMLNVCLV